MPYRFKGGFYSCSGLTARLGLGDEGFKTFLEGRGGVWTAEECAEHLRAHAETCDCRIDDGLPCLEDCVPLWQEYRRSARQGDR